MRRFSSSIAGTTIAAVGLAGLVAGCDKNFNNLIVVPTPTAGFALTRLVSDVSSFGAPTVDASLVNPWGIVFGGTGTLWVANNGSGTSTLYDASGAKQPLTVTIPSPTAATGGAPTGIVFNSTTDFAIPNSTAALFMFASEDGVITGWNVAAGSQASVVASRVAEGAVFKGLAIASNGGANFLYATDFHNGHVDMFDKNFAFVKSFTDPNVPAGFAPFGIANIGGKLYVTFAKQLAPENHDDQAGPGNGFVDVFNADGTVASRFASNGNLNSPWAVTLAPAGFGAFAGDILVGNFGDGRIGAYNATTGAFVGFINDANNAPIVIDGVWGLAFGPAAGSTTLYFASGPDHEAHGLVGTLTPR